MTIDEMERIPDVSDIASDLEEKLRIEGVKRIQAKCKAPPDFDGVHCTECGEPIPQDRLATGAYTDIDCQRAIEFRSKNHRSYFE